MTYQGQIFKRGDDYFVHVNNDTLKQKVYPLSHVQINFIDRFNSEIVEVQLIPNQGELDEQLEYTARIINIEEYDVVKGID
jgi:hypothetical protein